MTDKVGVSPFHNVHKDIRQELLSDTLNFISGDSRGAVYGDFEDTMEKFEIICETLDIRERDEMDSGTAGALRMAVLKLVRITKNPVHRDSYLDAINYLAQAYASQQASGAIAAVDPAPALALNTPPGVHDVTKVHRNG